MMSFIKRLFGIKPNPFSSSQIRKMDKKINNAVVNFSGEPNEDLMVLFFLTILPSFNSNPKSITNPILEETFYSYGGDWSLFEVGCYMHFNLTEFLDKHGYLFDDRFDYERLEPEINKCMSRVQ